MRKRPVELQRGPLESTLKCAKRAMMVRTKCNVPKAISQDGQRPGTAVVHWANDCGEYDCEHQINAMKSTTVMKICLNRSGAYGCPHVSAP